MIRNLRDLIGIPPRLLVGVARLHRLEPRRTPDRRRLGHLPRLALVTGAIEAIERAEALSTAAAVDEVTT